MHYSVSLPFLIPSLTIATPMGWMTRDAVNAVMWPARRQDTTTPPAAPRRVFNYGTLADQMEGFVDRESVLAGEIYHAITKPSPRPQRFDFPSSPSVHKQGLGGGKNDR